jgi:RNA polymerase sigma factor (sigma-70 family)
MSLVETFSVSRAGSSIRSASEGPGARLRRDQEAALVRRAQEGDRAATEHLIQAHSRLIYKVARRYHCRSYSLEDLVQEGILGLILAVERFDPARGCRLSTYAMHWIRQSIARAVEQNDRLIHVPMHTTSEVRRLIRLQDELHQSCGRLPTNAELAEASGIAEERVMELLRTLQDALSLEGMVGADQDASILDLVEDPLASSPELAALRGAARQQVRTLICALRPRERTVLEERFGFDGRIPRTLDELSRTLQVSRERVRQIEAQAIRKLRHAMTADIA